VKFDEATLDGWSHQGATAQSAQTYATIKGVLEDKSAPYASKDFEVFLQGSYGNNTNIRIDSDVDIVVCLTDVFYPGLQHLDEAERSLYDSLRSPGGYSLSEFKASVVAWLMKNFGSSVQVGNKAIMVKGSGNRRDADVLVCAEYKEYWSYKQAFSSDFSTGIVFWTETGQKIVNFPKQHRDNISSRNQAYHSRLKPLVRITKNLRNRMQDDHAVAVGKAPSYFLEGLLRNMPYDRYEYTHRGTIDQFVAWLGNLDTSELTCANGIHWLVRPGFPTSWKTADFSAFRQALQGYWN